MKLAVDINELYSFFKMKGLSERTIKEYGSYYDVFPFDDFTEEGITGFLQLKRCMNTVGRAFVKNLFEFIRVHNYPIEIKELAINYQIPKVTGRKRRELPGILREIEVEKIASAMKNKKTEIMIYVQYYGALRVSELLNIKPYDFGWELWLENPNEPGELKVTGKGDKQRIVYIPKELMGYVYDWIRDDVTRRQKKDEKLFKMGYGAYIKYLHTASIKALGKKIKTHNLRQSMATNLRKKGWPIERIKEYLGHENINTTMLYTPIAPEEIKDKIREIYSID